MSNEDNWKEIPTKEFFNISLEDGVTVRGEWPGAENVRVMVREKEEKRPSLPTIRLFDGVIVQCPETGWYYRGVVVDVNDTDTISVVMDSGEQECAARKDVCAVFRDGKEIYSSTP